MSNRLAHQLARGGSLFVRAACFVLLAACGSGGGYGGGGGGGGGGGAAASTGTFIDALTAGVQYSASGAGYSALTGTTNGNGQFSYYAGQTVTFSLAGGAGGSVALGSAMPVAPASGNAVVFVGGMNNALQVAQVLQSLNHAASAGAIDVSSLTLSATDVANLNAFISSGGTSFGSATSYTAMMQSAQASATAAMSGLMFVYPGGATPAQAAANLATASGALTPPSSINVPGLYFYQFVASTVGTGAASFTDAGMVQEAAGSSANTGTSTGIDAAHALQSAKNVHTGTYSVSGNVLTETRTTNSGTQVTTVTVTYADSAKILFNISVAQNGTTVGTGSGNAYRLSALAPTDVAGRTLTLPSAVGFGCSSGASPQIAFSSSGTTYTTYCSGSATATGSGTVSAGPMGISAVQITAPPAMPTDTVQSTKLLALASGSVAAGSSGTLAILSTANETTIGVNGLFAFSAM